MRAQSASVWMRNMYGASFYDDSVNHQQPATGFNFCRNDDFMWVFIEYVSIRFVEEEFTEKNRRKINVFFVVVVLFRFCLLLWVRAHIKYGILLSQIPLCHGWISCITFDEQNHTYFTKKIKKNNNNNNKSSTYSPACKTMSLRNLPTMIKKTFSLHASSYCAVRIHIKNATISTTIRIHYYLSHSFHKQLIGNVRMFLFFHLSSHLNLSLYRNRPTKKICKYLFRSLLLPS